VGITEAKNLLADRQMGEQEAEATRFASHLLIPEEYLRKLLSTNDDMAEVIDGVNRADVSAMAATLRLSRVLQPGFMFLVEDGEDMRRVLSSGTVGTAAFAGGNSWDIRKLKRRAYDSGKSQLGGRTVHWFRFFDAPMVDLPDDPRSTTEILRSAIARIESVPAEQNIRLQRVNGVVSGSLSKDRASTVEQAFGILLHKVASSPQCEGLVDDEDFQLYLRRKAFERIERIHASP
jgi:hypothetical protein